MRLAGNDITVIALWLGHEQVTTTQIYLNSQELHQLGGKPQVSRSQDCRNSVPSVLVAAL
jgi:hypothetical protein